MPYYRCARCDLTVDVGAGYANSRVCADCGSDLHPATRVLVREVPPPALHLQMVREPESAGAVRRELTAVLGELDQAELEITLLLTTELVANSVKHAGPRAGRLFSLDLSLTTQLVRVTVTDDGDGFAAGPWMRERSANGHWGLRLVDELADRWSIERSVTTAVWFELDR